MSHTPTKKSRCDACGAAYNGCPLHAAAPELVAACTDAEEWLTLRHGEPPPDAETTTEYHRVIVRLRAALARVKGE